MDSQTFKSIFISLMLGILLISCSSSSTPNAADQGDDKEQIINLVRKMYEWNENGNPKYVWKNLISEDGKFHIGFDLDDHKLRLEELRKTNYFTEEFLNNLDRIVLTLDHKLRTKEFEWLVGDMPPFGSPEVNDWCKCQDYPSDDWWEDIQFKFIFLNNESATLTWTWGNPEWSKDFEYIIKVKKANGSWQISYLEGFDFDASIRKNW